MERNHTDYLQHMAAQYLASFGKQYVPEAADDSHTNLAWDSESQSLQSRPSPEGHSLALNLVDLSIAWVSPSQRYPLKLEGRSHGEVCVWLHHIALRCGYEEYDFFLHYKLDSGLMRTDQVYLDYDRERAAELIALRDVAQVSCEGLKSTLGLDTEIRVWPHHFDTGAYASMPSSEVSIGFGLAIPDQLVGDYYYYVSGYAGGQPVATDGLKPLTLGQWQTKDFVGATLPVTGCNEAQISDFMTEATKLLSA